MSPHYFNDLKIIQCTGFYAVQKTGMILYLSLFFISKTGQKGQKTLLFDKKICV